ncbi:hypothetical protein KKF84_12475, partial [Myxococcota bacterium]|nr:hypothetical protein [Myxococcota bacterium]MBU1536131.1 hypothetical protein [Myxococcota bacterium]
LQAAAELKAHEIMSSNYLKKAKLEKDLRNCLKAGKLFALAADITKNMEHALEAAACFSKVEEFPKAKEYAILAQKWNPDSPRGSLALARVYISAGLSNRARSILTEMLEKWPGNKDAVRLLKDLK